MIVLSFSKVCLIHFLFFISCTIGIFRLFFAKGLHLWFCLATILKGWFSDICLWIIEVFFFIASVKLRVIAVYWVCINILSLVFVVVCLGFHTLWIVPNAVHAFLRLDLTSDHRLRLQDGSHHFLDMIYYRSLSPHPPVDLEPRLCCISVELMGFNLFFLSLIMNTG